MAIVKYFKLASIALFFSISRVPEVFTKVAGAYIAHKNCPFISRMNLILMRMTAAGLVLKIKNDSK